MVIVALSSRRADLPDSALQPQQSSYYDLAAKAANIFWPWTGGSRVEEAYP
jgi:hypothetical protein